MKYIDALPEPELLKTVMTNIFNDYGPVGQDDDDNIDDEGEEGGEEVLLD